MKTISRLILAVMLIAPVLAATEPGAATEKAEVASVPAPHSAKGLERFMKLHESHLARVKEGPIDLLFFGDSITERWTQAPAVWNQYYGNRKAANFGVGGDRTQHLLWRIDHGALDGISPKVLVLLIGTNNANNEPPGPILRGITKVLGRIQEKLPTTKILLLGVFPREPRKGDDANRPLQTIRQLNPELAKLADGSRVRFLDISEKFLTDGRVPKELMPDGVHLSPAGYAVWAQAIEPTLVEMLK